MDWLPRARSKAMAGGVWRVRSTRMNTVLWRGAHCATRDGVSTVRSRSLHVGHQSAVKSSTTLSLPMCRSNASGV